ncbi:MAG: efflux RND transporter periplasmic adaptor subunit [Nibricoccus sp.]
MNAKILFAILLTAAVAGTAGYFVAQHSHGSAASSATTVGRKIKFYQSPMHPWIKADKPGKCTICGMDLVPVYEGDAGFETKNGLVTLTPATASVIGVQTSEVKQGSLTRTLRVTGTIDDDDTRHRIVSAYTEVRLERLFVNQVGQEFAAGQPLALVYSPELLQARQEFHALAQSGGDSPLLGAAREKLIRLGLLPEQIDALAKADTVSRETEILAPVGGSVLERNAYEGSYVAAGAPILTIADFSKMWFLFDAYEGDLAWLRVGQNVDITTASRPGEVFTAPITFINPNLDPMTRTARVRVVLDNSERKLFHRVTATGVVRGEAPDSLLVPRSAVLYTQAKPLVYVDKSGGAYEPRTIEIAAAGDEAYAIRSGLRAGERVVTQGALLLDSQAQLAHSATGDHEHADTAQPSSTTTSSPSKQAEAHADVEALKPLVLASADAADALASDDLEKYQKLVPILQSNFSAYTKAFPDAAKGPLSQFTDGLKSGPDIKAARRAFEVFSTAVADLAKNAHLHHSGAVKIFQCPMSPVLGTGRWLQRNEPLRNPFFGSAMLECGEEIH